MLRLSNPSTAWPVGLLLATACAAGVWVIPSALSAPSAKSAPGTYMFSEPKDRADWMHITPGKENAFAPEGARLSSIRGRSCLLCLRPQPMNCVVEATSKKESGPANAWILPRFRDANNYYEVVLKENQIEVWRKQDGKYEPILEKKKLDVGDPAAPHTLKAKLVGAVPLITVWVDGKQVWSGKDETGLGPFEGNYVAIETEFSTVVVQSASIQKAE